MRKTFWIAIIVLMAADLFITWQLKAQDSLPDSLLSQLVENMRGKAPWYGDTDYLVEDLREGWYQALTDAIWAEDTVLESWLRAQVYSLEAQLDSLERQATFRTYVLLFVAAAMAVGWFVHWRTHKGIDETEVRLGLDLSNLALASSKTAHEGTTRRNELASRVEHLERIEGSHDAAIRGYLDGELTKVLESHIDLTRNVRMVMERLTQLAEGFNEHRKVAHNIGGDSDG